jgi:hypothetical protein
MMRPARFRDPRHLAQHPLPDAARHFVKSEGDAGDTEALLFEGQVRGVAFLERHAERLAKEHQHQRKELQVILALARSECDPQTVATILRNLLTDLILDMESEERWLLEVGPSAERNAS